MDDYYLTEREQWEALKRWIRENGLAVLAGVAVAAVGLGGYRWWQGHNNDVALAAGALYGQMENAFAEGNRPQAFVLLGDLERDYPSSPYADQARLASAGAFAADGDLTRAAEELRAVMLHSSDSVLRLVARLRLARVQISLDRPAEALVTLNGVDPGAFAPLYDEARGDAYHAMGENSAALAQYRLARATDTGGETDSGLLELKIADLAADVAASGARQSAGPTAPAAASAASSPPPAPAGKR